MTTDDDDSLDNIVILHGGAANLLNSSMESNISDIPIVKNETIYQKFRKVLQKSYDRSEVQTSRASSTPKKEGVVERPIIKTTKS